ncbi:MAG: CRTAC1 family protein, partial [Alphaproteobacteria bacterium]
MRRGEAFLPPLGLGRVAGRAAALLGLVALAVGLGALPARAGFTDVTQAAGIDVWAIHSPTTVEIFSGGVAAGDYDHDGFVDLYVTRGQAGFPCLYRNLGNGSFEDATSGAGLAGATGLWSSATFADVDGDGWLDVVLLGILDVPPRLYLNRRDGTFALASGTGLSLPGNSFSASFGDVDQDGDLDMFAGRWGTYWGDLDRLTEKTGHLWLNDGSGNFTDASGPAGLSSFTTLQGEVVFDWWTFTGNFADVDRDGFPDLLVTGDFGNSKILHNRGDGTFEPVVANGVPDDENGMGGAVGDVDGDGDLDWFVSAIFDPAGPQPDWGGSGNRLYLNDGTGHFSDATTAAGVREGGWGWGSTFADFDGDGDLDLAHVNGYSSYWGPTFAADPTRIFLSNGDGTFVESAAALGAAVIDDDRGIVAFDYDRDGDVDLFLSPNQGGARLLRNDGPSRPTITAKLRGRGANTEAIGARLELETAAGTQVRELRAGGNFASQDPAEAVFGFGDASTGTLRVAWPNGTSTTLDGAKAGRIVLSEPAPGE